MTQLENEYAEVILNTALIDLLIVLNLVYLHYILHAKSTSRASPRYET
jgi:hypothetical protein